jgi:HlyD family secretion protein
MKILIRSVIVLVILAGIGAFVQKPVRDYFRKMYAPKWRTAPVGQGRIVAVVNASGTVNPVRTITVGSFVSGPIDVKVPIADFNQPVKQGDILAKVEELIYNANLERDTATLLSRKADLERSHALHQQAQRDLERAILLREEDKGYISQAEMDRLYFNVKTLKAQVDVAKASVDVADSQVKFSELQVTYCKIIAPENGIVIDRKISPGQTLASQFQTPELFVIGVNMRERMNIEARVDEADIGLIRAAGDRKLPVTFTVDAYPDELFTGSIDQVRLNSNTTQNVVTYPVVVAAPNPELKLLPGMTASISFEVDERPDAIRIPNAALRFYPNPLHVRKEDRPLVEGLAGAAANASNNESDSDSDEKTDSSLSASERHDLRRKKAQRHVWVVDGEFLRAIPVETGLSDNQYTELVSGDLKPGVNLVTGQDLSTTTRS